MSNKQAIEQQLNHIIENTDRLETIYSTSAQFFSMVSLSYELIDLIGKLNEEEKNLFFSPPLFVDYSNQDSMACFPFAEQLERLHEATLHIREYTFSAESVHTQSLPILMENEERKPALSQFFVSKKDFEVAPAKFNLPECNEVISGGFEGPVQTLVHLFYLIAKHLSNIQYRILHPDFSLVLRKEKEYLKTLPIWKNEMNEFRTNKAFDTQDATNGEIRIFLKEYRKRKNQEMKRLSFFGIIQGGLKCDSQNLDVVLIVARLHAMHKEIDVREFYTFVSIVCLNDVIHGEMLQNERSEEQQQPHNTTYNSLNVYGDFNYCPNGPQKDAARDFSARKDRDNTDSLRNCIFDTRLFDSDDKLNALLGEIARSIDLGEYNAIYGPNEHGRINPSAKNEWYYIFEALLEAGVCRQSVGDKEFVEQMMEWFPMVFSYDTPEEMKSMTDKLRKSVSHERTLWKYGESKEVTKLKDMWARRNQLGIAYEKVSRFYEIAYRGLYVRLVEMKKELNSVK